MQKILIDGSYGEGGGQIIRTSLTLSALTGQSAEVINIRAKRKKPGLWAQHLTACQAVNAVCHGELQGGYLGSQALIFKPGQITGGNYQFDVGTAGSIILVAQSIIPILLKAKKPSAITIIGGTHVLQSPCYDYFAEVFLPAIHNLGANVQAKLIKPGYYPKGGGIVELIVQPSDLHGFDQWRTCSQVHGIIRLSKIPKHVALREKQWFTQHGIDNVRVYIEDSFSAGNAVTLIQGLKGAYSLGERGKPAEQVAQEAIEILQAESGEIDRHLADQLLIYLALAARESNFSTADITQHLETNAYVIQKFLNKEIILKKNHNIATVTVRKEEMANEDLKNHPQK